MKLLALFTSGLAFIFILGISCSSNGPTESNGSAEVEVTIVNWTQRVTRLDSTRYYDPDIYYKIENIGQLDISSYEIYFRVETTDGNFYEGTGFGGEAAGFGDDLKVGEIDFPRATIDTNSEKAKAVEITGQFLEAN